jgi:lipoprotein
MMVSPKKLKRLRYFNTVLPLVSIGCAYLLPWWQPEKLKKQEWWAMAYSTGLCWLAILVNHCHVIRYIVD